MQTSLEYIQYSNYLNMFSCLFLFLIKFGLMKITLCKMSPLLWSTYSHAPPEEKCEGASKCCSHSYTGYNYSI